MNTPPRRENNSIGRQFKDLGSLQRMGQALGFPATPSFEKPKPSIRVIEGGGKTSPIKINTDPMKFKVPGQGKVVATREGGPSGRLVGNLGRGGFLGGGGTFGRIK